MLMKKNQKNTEFFSASRTKPLILKGRGHAAPVMKNFQTVFCIRTIRAVCGNSAGRNLSAGNPCRRRHRPSLNPCRRVQVGVLRFGHWSMCEDNGDKKTPKKQDRSFGGNFTPKRNRKRSLQNQRYLYRTA